VRLNTPPPSLPAVSGGHTPSPTPAGGPVAPARKSAVQPYLGAGRAIAPASTSTAGVAGYSSASGRGSATLLSTGNSPGHAHASALAVATRRSATLPGVPGHRSPPSAGQQAASAPVASTAPPAEPMWVGLRRSRMLDSPAPNPLRGLPLQSESGQALQVALIALAAMVLSGVLFGRELRISERYRHLVRRRAQRPRI
jgi:hypothetical protein